MYTKGLKNRRGNPLSAPGIQKMLRNPAYIGKVSWKGVEYDGNHEPIIKHATWLRAQAVLDKNRIGVKQSRHEHYLKSAPIYCICGGRMSFTIKPGDYAYLYCLATCGQSYAPIADIEQEILDIYRYVRISEELGEQLKSQLEEVLADQEVAQASENVFLQKRIKRLLNEREKLMQAYYADALPLDLFKEQQQRIAQETSQVEAQLEEQGAPAVEARETLDLALQLAERLDKAYEQSANGAREQLNETVFQRIIVENKHVSDYELAEPFRWLLEDRVFQNRNSGGAEGI